MVNLRKSFFSLIIIFIAVSGSSAQEKEISFAISPMASPVSTFSSYNDFVKYLSEKTGAELVMKQRRKYAEINSLLKTGEAQFAYTCTGAFLSGKSEFGLELLAVPVINGKSSYNSYIIVNKESNIKDFPQFREKIFAFTDPLSFTGRLYPLYLLHELEVKPNEFFSKTFYTSSHEKSIESVAYGFADGAAVDSLIYEDMKRTKNPAIDRVRIISISPPYGIPPIVVSPTVEKATKQVILNILLKMTDDPVGREILTKLHIDKFILPEPAIYFNAARLRNLILPQ
jgi:phosphonate transport system substrate-binding protein